MSAYGGIQPLAALEATEVEWFWFPRIPLGSITLVFGQAGIGKSTMMYDVLARASRGDCMPNSVERPKPPYDVDNARSLIIGTEDTPQHVAGVLERAGADLDSIGIVPQDALPDPTRSPMQQLGFIEAAMKKFRCRVLYIDNVSEAMLATTDSNNERSVRAALRPLDSLSKRMNAAVIMLTHPKKGAGRYQVIEGITGSQAFVNLARAVLYVAPVPGSDTVGLCVAKSNYYVAWRTNSLHFKVMSEVVGTKDGHEILSVPWVEWMGLLPMTAQELSSAGAKEAAKLAEAAEGGHE